MTPNCEMSNAGSSKCIRSGRIRFSPLMLHNAVTLISTRGFWEDGDEDSGCEEMEPNPFKHVHLDFVS